MPCRMKPVILAAPGSADPAQALCQRLDAELGDREIRSFPDGECYVRIDTPLAGRDVAIVCSLDRPGDKIIPLLFLAATARDLGAARVGLVAPYLAFMRQDHRFHPGEGVTSVYFAALLSRAVDWLVTVEPHLHRFSSLDQLYTIPTRVARAAPSIAAWIGDNVSDPVIIGPDAESAQWAVAVADLIDAPFAVLDKVRRGDREVEVSLPDLALCEGRTPVIIDDIISTAHTMIEPVNHLLRAGVQAPVCIGVHAVFADDAYRDLEVAGAARVVTCNTIAHHSNVISVDDALAAAVGELLR
jgi:ribose-phosphate pyrophosphokinase